MATPEQKVEELKKQILTLLQTEYPEGTSISEIQENLATELSSIIYTFVEKEIEELEERLEK